MKPKSTMARPSYGNEEYIVHHIEYGPYEREIRTPDINDRRRDSDPMGYHRSSSSSMGSSAGSGQQLVKPHYYPSPQTHTKVTKGRLERGYNFKEDKHHSGNSSSGAIKPTMFYISPPSMASSSEGYQTPRRLSPSPDLQPPNPNGLLHVPGYGLQLHPGMLTEPDKNSKISSIYDAYWHLPKSSLWCGHKNCGFNDQKCSQCQLKDEETSSTCSSVNPPPTFTAIDNYRPIKRKSSKKCGGIFIATATFSMFILILIAGFILYVEIVVKPSQYVPDPM